MDKRKFKHLILALAETLTFDSDLQAGFEAFLGGRLQLCDKYGDRLNPYDYLSRDGKPLIRFGYISQEKAIEGLWDRLFNQDRRCGQSQPQATPRQTRCRKPQTHERRIVLDLEKCGETRIQSQSTQAHLRARQCQVAFVAENGDDLWPCGHLQGSQR